MKVNFFFYILPIAFLTLISASCSQSPKNKQKLHTTYKLDQSVSISFDSKASLKVSSLGKKFTDFHIEVLHDDGVENKVTLLTKQLESSEESLNLSTEDIEKGLIIAILKFKDAKSESTYSKVATYKIGEQKEINKAKKKITSKNR